MHNVHLLPYLLFGTFLITAFALAVIISVVINKQRQVRNSLARQQMAFEYSQSLLNTRVEVRETTPMRLDAYYISMLSEQYKTGKSHLVSAIWNGFNANMTGAEDKEKYSSLVYVLQSLD